MGPNIYTLAPMGSSNFNIILICYGTVPVHYHGCRNLILSLTKTTFSGSAKSAHDIYVATTVPAYFSDLPVNIIGITKKEIESWVTPARYHFLIKPNALLKILETAPGRFLYLDSDICLLQSSFKNLAKQLKEDEKSSTAYLFRCERTVSKSKNKSTSIFEEKLRGRGYPLPSGLFYTYSRNKSQMWGSAMIFLPENKADLILRDSIYLAGRWVQFIPSHTIEQFALSESIRTHGLSLEALGQFVTHFSTSSRKKYANKTFIGHWGADISAPPQYHAKTLVDPTRPLSNTIHEKFRKWLNNSQS